MRYLSIFCVAVILLAVVLGCNWSFGTNSNSTSNSNSNSGNRDSYNNSNDDYGYDNSNVNSNSDPNRDLSPTTMDIAEMVSGSGDEEMVGRMVTVTGGVLENIDSTTLRIRGAYGGQAFYCYGDFTDYLSMSDRVRSLSQSGKSPKATVKGVYKISSTGTGGELSPCVLSDIQK